MERIVRTFETHQAADEADEARYREMSGNEKLRILQELIATENPDEAVVQRFARVYPPAQMVKGQSGYFLQQHPVLGTIKVLNLPFHFSDCDTSPTGPVPLLGQHNRAIATESGFSDAEITGMGADGVLYAHPDVARVCNQHDSSL